MDSLKHACAACLLAALPSPALAGDTPAPPPRQTTMLGRHDNELLFAKITVSDLVRSYRFYTEVIGLKLAAPQMKPPGPGDPERDFVEVPLNFTGSLADPFFVIVKRKGVFPTPDNAALTIIGLKVPSARAALSRAVAAGYPSAGRMPGPGPMAAAFTRDPDGYTIEFMQAGNYPEK